MKKIIILIFFFFPFFSISQNLVPNPSFEDTVSCPTTISEIFKADYWSSFRITPDYYHTCDNPINGVVGVPNNNLGYQYPHSGLAHAGIICYDLTGAPPSQREYIGVHLITPLTIGQKYFLTYYVSWLGSPGFGIAINKLGAALTTVNYSQSNPYPITNAPIAYSDSIYADSAGWSLVNLSFVADSAYQYLVIGNFFDDSHTDTIHKGQFNTHSYYYIDDVCLSPDSLYSVNWLGIERTSPLKTIIIFPNPVDKTINIKHTNTSLYYIINLCGQNVSSGVLKPDEYEIDVSNLSNGFYFIGIDNKEFYKIIINH